MPHSFKLGKKPAVVDTRVPRMSRMTQGQLPAPPDDCNWYAEVGEWLMLLNNLYGCCVEAAIFHCIMQFSAYAGKPLIPTDQEVIKFYEVTGFNPNDPSTDNGSYVLGPDGMATYWAKNGIMCGGVLNKVTGIMQITQKNPVHWRQGISTFAGMLAGISLPAVIMEADEVPYLWHDYSGPVAGGHEIWINGYETLNMGVVYDLISWGGRYRATEDFLMHCLDEAVVVVDEVELNARGVNAAGLNKAQLTADMALLNRG